MSTTIPKIDFLIVIYRNYDLLYLQIENFKELAANVANPIEHNIIFIDNTPELYRQDIDEAKLPTNCKVYVNESPDHSHDGASQGSAINYGRQYCTSEYVCILDSDFFITNPKILDKDYLINLIGDNQAVGTEYYDGEPTIPQCWAVIRSYREKYFTNIPCCFCMIVNQTILNCDSWITTAQESSTGWSNDYCFIETGWRIRRYILDNNIKTAAFSGMQIGPDIGTESPTFFLTFDRELFGVHYQRGSHRKSNLVDIQLPDILSWCRTNRNISF